LRVTRRRPVGLAAVLRPLARLDDLALAIDVALDDLLVTAVLVLAIACLWHLDPP
jgi:hypothetical protein